MAEQRTLFQEPDEAAIDEVLRLLDRRPEEGRRTLQQLYDRGSLWAKLKLGHMYYKGLYGLPRDLSKAEQMFLDALSGGSLDARVYLGAVIQEDRR